MKNELRFIKGSLSNTAEVEKLHPRFKAAFEFLRKTDLKSLKPGRYDIDGDNLYASVSDLELKPVTETMKYEFHRRYIDIQVPITDDEELGVVLTPEIPVDFDTSKDIAFFDGKGEVISAKIGEFVIFYPNTDSHAPGHSYSAPRAARKIVVKVLN